ncbi:MAG: DUF47 family protein [Holophagaceae bacterium]|nr:DUF47 family protein [Holophagaceae bacterium]
MSLNTLLKWLKPREMVFFDLLEAAATNVASAAQHLDRELRTGDPSRFPEMRREMKDFEHKGDELTHELIDRLNQVFVTPIEREDILALTHALDDVVDRLDTVCERIVLYRIQHIMPALTQLTSNVVEGSGELVHLIKALRTMSDIKDIRARIQHCHVLENQADSVYHAAIAQIFENPTDPIELIKWKELLSFTEDATDRIELVAQVVGSTVMKNA